MIFRNPFKQKNDIVNLISVLVFVGAMPFLYDHLYAIVATVIMVYSFALSILITNKLVRILIAIIFLGVLVVCTVCAVNGG